MISKCGATCHPTSPTWFLRSLTRPRTGRHSGWLAGTVLVSVDDEKRRRGSNACQSLGVRVDEKREKQNKTMAGDNVVLQAPLFRHQNTADCSLFLHRGYRNVNAMRLPTMGEQLMRTRGRATPIGVTDVVALFSSSFSADEAHNTPPR